MKINESFDKLELLCILKYNNLGIKINFDIDRFLEAYKKEFLQTLNSKELPQETREEYSSRYDIFDREYYYLLH